MQAAQKQAIPRPHSTLQDHAPKTTPFHIGNNASQDYATKVTSQPIGNNALQDPTPKSSKNNSLQDHNFTVKDV